MGGLLSKRWEMAMLLLSAIALVYTLRVNMSVAAVKMKDELNWSEDEKGYVLSAFYWGYTVGQIPASMYAQIHGAKWMLGLSVAIPSLLTMLVPAACRHSLTMAFIIRVLIGFFESATFPAVYHYFHIWVPSSEKTVMIPVILSGIYVGEIIGFSLSGALAGSSFLFNGEDWGGWPSIFYVFGFSGLLWFPLWMVAAHESPSVHPSITLEEVQLINKGKDIPCEHQHPHSDGSENPLLGLSHPDYTSMEGQLDDSDAATPVRYGGVSPLVHRSSSAAGTSSASLSGNTSTYNMHSSHSAHNHTYVPNATRMRSTSKDELLVSTADSSHSSSAGRYTKAELIARTPWRQFVSHPVALALLTSSFGFGWISFTLLSEMPSYLTDILGFDLGSAGLLCVFPYLALFVSTLGFARGFDYLQREKGWEVKRVRRVAMAVAYMGSGAGLVVCCFLQDKYAAYGFMVLTQVLFGAAQTGIGCIWTDTAPVYSSQLNSVGNTMGALAGVTGPIVVSFLVSTWPGVLGWRIAFILTFYMCTVFTTVWFYFIKAEIVPALNTPSALTLDNK